MQDKKTMELIRMALGWLCFMLVPCSVGFGFLAYEENGPKFWWSVSATYYANSKPFMIGILFTTAIFFICYKGYDWKDRLIADISAISALGIIIFPCDCFASPDKVGIFNINVSVSHIIHCISAAVLFGSFAYMIRFQFTKGGTIYFYGKRKRNQIYKWSARIIMLAMLAQVITSLFRIGWMTVINEAIMLDAMAFAWLVKAGAFKSLRDRW